MNLRTKSFAYSNLPNNRVGVGAEMWEVWEVMGSCLPCRVIGYLGRNICKEMVGSCQF